MSIENPALPAHQIVFNEVVNGGTISGGMLKAGYAPSTAKRTEHITKTKGWKYLVNKHLGDQKLARIHDQGLGATDNQGNIDYSVRHKYLDTAYKIKDKYPQKTINAFQFNFGQDQQKFKE